MAIKFFSNSQEICLIQEFEPWPREDKDNCWATALPVPKTSQKLGKYIVDHHLQLLLNPCGVLGADGAG